MQQMLLSYAFEFQFSFLHIIKQTMSGFLESKENQFSEKILFEDWNI